jgi:protein disulfide-isomerase A1
LHQLSVAKDRGFADFGTTTSMVALAPVGFLTLTLLLATRLDCTLALPLAQIDRSNFTSFVAGSTLVLLLHALPECPHEPSGLRPLLSSVTGLLPAAVRVAVSEDAQLAETSGIRSFPALRLYHGDADAPAVFRGPLTSATALASHLRREASPALLEATTTENIYDEIRASELTAVLFATPGSMARTVFAALPAADARLRRQVSFVVASPSLANELAESSGKLIWHGKGQGQPFLVLCRGLDGPDAETFVYPGELSAEGNEAASGEEATAAAESRAHTEAILEQQLASWLGLYRLPLLAEIGPHNFDQYEARGGVAAGGRAEEAAPPLPLFWLFVNASAEEAGRNDDARELVRSVAAGWRGRALFVWLDAERYEQHAASLALNRELLPALAAEHDGAHYVYAPPTRKGAAAPDAADAEGGGGGGVGTSAWEPTVAAREQLGGWVRGVVAGTLAPTLRSVAPPLLNLEPLTIVVASTFDELVLEATVDVLLLVTTDWCDGCEALDAEFEAVAGRWQDESRVRIARFDAGVNDLPRTLRIDKLPTILFIRAGATDAYELSHHRTERELTDAIVTHASTTLERPADLEEIRQAIEMLPRLQSETRALLEENARLRAELAALRQEQVLPQQRE